jgi:hypothetical protein
MLIGEEGKGDASPRRSGATVVTLLAGLVKMFAGVHECDTDLT